MYSSTDNVLIAGERAGDESSQPEAKDAKQAPIATDLLLEPGIWGMLAAIEHRANTAAAPIIESLRAYLDRQSDQKQRVLFLCTILRELKGAAMKASRGAQASVMER